MKNFFRILLLISLLFGFQYNSNAAENTSSDFFVDFLANGFKLRDNDAQLNGSGSTYIYMAFAEAPLVSSNGVPAVAR